VKEAHQNILSEKLCATPHQQKLHRKTKMLLTVKSMKMGVKHRYRIDQLEQPIPSSLVGT
jgi:hypothetical protein